MNIVHHHLSRIKNRYDENLFRVWLFFYVAKTQTQTKTCFPALCACDCRLPQPCPYGLFFFQYDDGKRLQRRLFSLAAAIFPTPETIRGMSTSFRRNDFWDRLGGQAFLTIG